MKKFIYLILLSLVFTTASAADLKFEPANDTKFIYCNNPEGITDDILMNGEKSYYIMNNENIGPGEYYIYLSHFNYTGSGGIGYDIELDVELTPGAEGCTYNIKNAAMETPRPSAWYDNGVLQKSECDWGLLNCCAKILNKPICDIDGKNIYMPYQDGEFRQKTIVASSDTMWLSSFIPDYKKVHFPQPVHMQAILEIEEGSMNINVCAFKSGEKVGDRSGFNENAEFGYYRRDKCVKGIADATHVQASLEYTIDDDTEDETYLPVTVYNQYVPEGNTVTEWVTNLSPQSDKWSKRTLAESDMVQIKYKDDSKLQYYGSEVSESERDNVWIFDCFHSDTKEYDIKYNFSSKDIYSPNFVLDIDKYNDDYACNLGNYGIKETYNLKVTNKGTKTRYFNHYLTTASNVIAYIADKNGDFDSAYAKRNDTAERKTDVMDSITLPPGETTEFSVNLILPVNYNGGMVNSFVITDEDKSYPDYSYFNDRYPIITEYKPIFGTLLSDVKHKLPDETYDKFYGNFDSYEILEGKDCYLVRWCACDGKPNYYYGSWGVYEDVYVLDKDFNITRSSKFKSLPTSVSFYEGSFYLQTLWNGAYKSDDGINWTEAEFLSDKADCISEYTLPEWAEIDIQNAVKSGLVPAYLKDVKNIDNNITREEFCDIAVRLLSEKNIKSKNTYVFFTDTSSESVKQLSSLKIVLGYEDNTFRPDNSITREEAAVILSRIYTLLYGNAESDYEPYSDDDTISDWAKESVYKMQSAEIMKGIGNNIFDSQSGYTIAQSIVTIMRLI